MYDRFTDRARQVLQQTNHISLRLGHEYVHAEHILLGLLSVRNTVTQAVLKDLGVDTDSVAQALEAKLQSPDYDGPGHPPTGKRIIENSIREARDLGHNYVGTEHILLALVRESDGLTASAFRELGLTYEPARERVLVRLGPLDPAPTSSLDPPNSPD